MIFIWDLKNVDPVKLSVNPYTYNARVSLSLTGEECKIVIDPLLTKASTDPEALSPADAHGRSGDTPLPPNCPDEEQIKFANQAFPTVNIEQQVLLFRDYYRDKLRTNWREAWKSWCARAQTDRRDPNRKEGNDDPRIDPYLDAAKALRSGECESETSE